MKIEIPDTLLVREVADTLFVKELDDTFIATYIPIIVTVLGTLLVSFAVVFVNHILRRLTEKRKIRRYQEDIYIRIHFVYNWLITFFYDVENTNADKYLQLERISAGRAKHYKHTNKQELSYYYEFFYKLPIDDYDYLTTLNVTLNALSIWSDEPNTIVKSRERIKDLINILVTFLSEHTPTKYSPPQPFDDEEPGGTDHQPQPI